MGDGPIPWESDGVILRGQHAQAGEYLARWRWGRVKLSACCSSRFVVVRQCRDYPHVLLLSFCDRAGAFAGTDVQTGVR
jgi:hypothetical protein